ncbi:RING finger protein 24 [Trifolium pratense]|uniref:RING finger protein 24 n=1 Tax=Trifolium pratense TaxID=57577 RepID=UPI001E6922E3|nr:RING finger protein 24 [Trifolium pratense]
MGFYTQQSISNLTISQAIYEAALIIAVLRWIFCLVFRIINNRKTEQEQQQKQHSSCCQMLPLTSFGEIKERHPETSEDSTCAVCLNKLKMEDEVRELMNCDHVFHRECIDKWLEHGYENENHNQTCPLCRAPLINSFSVSSEISSCAGFSPPQPSWAVERLLYLFGDDLLPC